MNNIQPGLFGIKNSNRDFTNEMSWGKNQFNSSFPAALGCYMSSKGMEPVYLQLSQELKVVHGKIKTSDIFCIDPLSPKAFYAFESIYTPYDGLVVGNLPRIDLVTSRLEDSLTKPLCPLEIKLTALPDNQTFGSKEEDYGSEIVVRPDTIVYLALSIASSYVNEKNILLKHLEPVSKKISDWRSIRSVAPVMSLICNAIDDIITEKINFQKPLMLQPVWKTQGKKLLLSENCLDMFVWSDFAFTRLFIDVARSNAGDEFVARHSRCAVWVAKMLLDFAETGKINHGKVIDEITFDTKNDKAFAVSGNITRRYMKSPETLKPRIRKEEIKYIILGGGEKLLSPERRFDAAVMSTPGLFE